MNQDKTPHYSHFPLIVVTMFLGIVGYGCLCHQCSQPKGPCPIDTLLITQSQLPGNIWESGGAPSADMASSEVGVEKIGVAFFTSSQGGISQQIYRFLDLDEPLQYYNRSVSGWYSQRKDETKWLTPDDLRDLPVAADRYDLRCSNSLHTGVENCWYFAQYTSYVVELNATTLVISHEQLSGLIIEIDQRILQCLSNKK